jgi:hypothetical protein
VFILDNGSDVIYSTLIQSEAKEFGFTYMSTSVNQHFHAGFLACINNCSSEYLLVVAQGDRVRANLFSIIDESLTNSPLSHILLGVKYETTELSIIKNVNESLWEIQVHDFDKVAGKLGIFTNFALVSANVFYITPIKKQMSKSIVIENQLPFSGGDAISPYSYIYYWLTWLRKEKIVLSSDWAIYQETHRSHFRNIDSFLILESCLRVYKNSFKIRKWREFSKYGYFIGIKDWFFEIYDPLVDSDLQTRGGKYLLFSLKRNILMVEVGLPGTKFYFRHFLLVPRFLTSSLRTLFRTSKR